MAVTSLIPPFAHALSYHCRNVSCLKEPVYGSLSLHGDANIVEHNLSQFHINLIPQAVAEVGYPQLLLTWGAEVSEHEPDVGDGCRKILKSDVIVRRWKKVYMGRRWNSMDMGTAGVQAAMHLLYLSTSFVLNWGAFCAVNLLHAYHWKIPPFSILNLLPQKSGH